MGALRQRVLELDLLKALGEEATLVRALALVVVSAGALAAWASAPAPAAPST